MSSEASSRRRAGSMPASASSAWAAAASCASMALTIAGSVRAVGDTRVATKSRRRSAISSPNAEKLPGIGGTSTVPMPSSSAIAAACSGPAPP